APGRRRVPLLLQDGRLHRHALRLHGGAEGPHRALGERRGGAAARALVSPAVDEVQRRAVRDPARGGGRLHARRRHAGARDHRLLHGERAVDPRGAGGGGAARAAAGAPAAAPAPPPEKPARAASAASGAAAAPGLRCRTSAYGGSRSEGMTGGGAAARETRGFWVLRRTRLRLVAR